MKKAEKNIWRGKVKAGRKNHFENKDNKTDRMDERR